MGGLGGAVPVAARHFEKMTGIVRADVVYESALRTVEELFSALRLDHVYVGEVAMAAWLGRELQHGSIDTLVLTSPERVQQIPMMAANRGFIVDPEKVEAARELDLVPMALVVEHTSIRVHALLASNALYAKMIPAAVVAEFSGMRIRVVAAEDLALLVTMSDREDAPSLRDELIEAAGDDFNVERFNQRLVSIGLGEKMVHR